MGWTGGALDQGQGWGGAGERAGSGQQVFLWTHQIYQMHVRVLVGLTMGFAESTQVQSGLAAGSAPQTPGSS